MVSCNTKADSVVDVVVLDVVESAAVVGATAVVAGADEEWVQVLGELDGEVAMFDSFGQALQHALDVSGWTLRPKRLLQRLLER